MPVEVTITKEVLVEVEKQVMGLGVQVGFGASEQRAGVGSN